MDKAVLLNRSWWRNNYFKIFWIGLGTAFLFFLPFLIYDKGLFLYYGDFNVQQIPFYRLAHDAIRTGDVLWNWNTDLGSSFVGSYSFYLLGSPFFWLTIPFPSDAVPYLMVPLLMLKFAFTGVTGYGYIKRFTKTDNMALIGGLLYAFSGFGIYNIFFNHFNEVIMIFPLLLTAMEELLVNNRKGGFALAVALCAIFNYYFFFGQVIFCVLYFFIRCTSPDCRFTWKKFGLLAVEAVIGVLLAAFLLLPSLFAVLGNPRAGDTLTGYDLLLYGNVQRYGLILSSFFFPPDIPARPNFFPDSNSKWSSVSMFLPVISMTGVIAFFRGKKKHWAKTLLIVSFIICFIPVLNSTFAALNYSYYARWFYMPLLIMAMASCVAFEDCVQFFRSAIKWCAVFVGAFTLIGILPKKVDGVLKWFSLPPFQERFWAYVLIAIVGLLCTAMLAMLTTRSRYFQRCAIVSVCAITVIYASFMIFTGKQSGDNYDIMYNKAIHGAEHLDLPDDDTFYRIDTYDEVDNLGMFWKMPTINAFQSVVPSSIMDYYDLVGGERGVASRPDPKLVGTRGLLSVKYRFIRDTRENADAAPVGFSYYDNQNGYNIYQNDHFVPMGFTYDAFLTEAQVLSCPQDTRDRVLLKGLCLSDEDRVKYQDINPLLSMVDIKDTDEAAYFADCDERAANAVDRFSHDKSGFSATATLDRDNLVFFSVPHERGWSATINGEPAEIIKANGGFMAVLAPAGTNEIRFDYKTPGMSVGWIITGAALLIFIGYLFCIRRFERFDPDLRFRPHSHRYQEKNMPRIATRDAYILKMSSLKSDPSKRDDNRTE